MKRLLALALLTPAFALASTPFDGNWMLRLDSLKVSGKPDVYDLSNGTFTCTSCAPKLEGERRRHGSGTLGPCLCRSRGREGDRQVKR